MARQPGRRRLTEPLELTGRLQRTLRAVEEHSGLNRENFAASIGLNPASYYSLLRKLSNPQLAQVEKIAAYLGVPPLALFGDPQAVLVLIKEKTAA